MPSGNLKTELIDWKLTEIKLAKNELRHQETQGASREKERKLREHCWLELFLKSSAAWASTSAHNASTNVSKTAEPAHQRERQNSDKYEQEKEQNEQEEDEVVDMDNCMTVRHVFIMERLALIIY